MIDLYCECEKDPEVLQISGGEPTLHPDIIRILDYMGQKNILYPVLNTNGVALEDVDFAEKVASTINNNRSGNTKLIVYMQFDGFDNNTSETIRGKPLLDVKMKALENCEKLGMSVVLVSTIIKGINDHEIGPIINFAMQKQYIKAVNFQPVSLTGRYELEKEPENRITIPEVLYEIERQTNGILKKDHFSSVPCPYPTCSASSYVYNHNGRIVSVNRFLNSDTYRKFLVDRTLVDPEITAKIARPVNALNALNVLLSKNNAFCSDASGKYDCTFLPGLLSNSGKMMENITLISVHAFMDEYNFDVERAKKCCVTEILPNGQMIPFCAYNVLYRKKLSRQLSQY